MLVTFYTFNTTKLDRFTREGPTQTTTQLQPDNEAWSGRRWWGLIVIKRLINLQALLCLFLCHFVKELFISIFRLGQTSQAEDNRTTQEENSLQHSSHNADKLPTIMEMSSLHKVNFISYLETTLYIIIKTRTFWRKKCACHQKVQIFYQNVNFKNLESSLSYKISTIVSITRQPAGADINYIK